MARYIRWQAPQLHVGEEADVGPAAPDLFYDLVFAVVMAQLATRLATDMSASGLLTFVLLTLAALRLWIPQTLYADRFAAIDVSYRLYVFAAMVVAGGLAIAAPSGFGALFPLFAASYVLSRILQAGAWFRAGRHDPLVGSLARRFIVAFAIEDALWIAAVLASGSARVAFVIVALIASIVIPMTTVGLQSRLGEFSAEHLSDRFVDFFLIVLGQLVIFAIVIVTQARSPSIIDLAAGALSLTLAYVVWWIYVDHVVDRELRHTSLWQAWWIYLQHPVFVGAAAFGAAFFTFVVRGEQVVAAPARWLLCGSFAIVLICTGLAELSLVPVKSASGRYTRTALIHAVPAAAALVLAALGSGLTPIPLLLLLIAIGAILILAGEYVRTT